ncbi:hypothetical protein WUBG_06657 [Wuchereria bancrofti]|uniref:Uncharacterized protein n=2 Tax=Wuchereria bancrofti TaxID=6293 RepID=J9EJQ7_WUCBA|nr:hypothetical protein WUBG_06657 [Wuchereria bancrofti]VDM20722.1 unnamed protein product [Wuchereria bancrofti]
MDDCRLTRSPSISSFDTNHSSWSFVGEDDFDLLDQDEDDSASEVGVSEMEEEDEQIEEEDDDEGSDDDDDISVITEDMLNDSCTLTCTDFVKVSKQLDELSKCFDSPFTRILEDFALGRNLKFTAAYGISATAVAIIMFYYAFGVGKPESLSFTSTENVCFVNEDHFFGLQYRIAAPFFLRPFFEILLKLSIPAWSFFPFSNPKPHLIEPFPWIFNSETVGASQDEHGYFATNQCEHVSIEHRLSAVSETVRRYLRHTKKLKEPYRYESPVLPNINKTLVKKKSNHDGKLQMDLHLVITNSSENWNSTKTESPGHLESIKMEVAKFQKLPSILKLILPFPRFSANHFLIEPKLGLLAPVPLPELSMQREITSISRSIEDLAHTEKKCFKATPDIKSIKSLGKERTKLRYSTDLRSSLFADLKLRESKKLQRSNSKKEVRQPERVKSEVLLISSVKKVISRTVERAKVHRDKLLKQFKRVADNIARKNRPKTFRMREKTSISKERCMVNSTCNVLASLARTLAGITLFPAVVGQINAAKYINSLLDLSTCSGLRLVCEKCWWTRECCPKEICTFLPWQRHFNTKQFLASQGHKMFEAFEELGWSMPGKRKDGDAKPNFKPNHPNCFACSEKELRFGYGKKNSMERHSKKSDIQGRIH